MSVEGLSCCDLFSAPLANFIALKMSNRFIVFLGGILITAGFLLSIRATTIQYLYITYGGLVGKITLFVLLCLLAQERC